MIRKLFFTGLMAIVMAMVVNAQARDETAVANAVEKLRKAMIDGNRRELENMVLDKLSYGHSSGYVEDKTEFVDKIVSGKSDFVTIGLKDQTIRVNGKTAIVRHKLDATTLDSGKQGEVHLSVLLIFQKENKQWKLLARQAVKAAL
jgi:Domain of unknown function (DUF4440)